MDVVAVISTFASSLLSALEIGVAILLFVGAFERRPHFEVRLALVIVIVLIACFATPVDTNADNFEIKLITQIVGFSALLPILIAVVVSLYRISFWDSFFACLMAYTMQNLAYSIFSFIFMELGNLGYNIGDMRLNALCSVISHTVVYYICYHTLIKKLDANHLSAREDKAALLVFVVVLLVTVVFDMIVKTLPILRVSTTYVGVLRIVHIAVCTFMLYAEYEMLYNKRLEADAATLERLIGASERQYKMSRENIEAINIKCHDLKHQIRELRTGGVAVDSAALNELEHAVGIYDAVVKTGNDALDTILTEKSMICEQSDIKLSCIADGEILNDIAPSDLYSLFGNILDNAIEAASKIGDDDRRTIGLTIHEKLGMAVIHAENFYAGEVLMRDGLPVTSKRRSDGKLDALNHGFGTQSIRLIAQRYGGSMKCSAQNGVFTMDILLPAASEE